MAKRPPQRRQHSLKYKGYQYFYNDDEVTIEVKYHSNDDIHVHQISFKLRNTKKGEFAFCDSGIVEGKYNRNGNSWYDLGDEDNYSTTNFSHKLILHLVEGKKQNGVEKYIPKTPFKLDSGKEIIGLFWVHKDKCPQDLDDKFPDVNPETKDGTIVEGI